MQKQERKRERIFHLVHFELLPKHRPNKKAKQESGEVDPIRSNKRDFWSGFDIHRSLSVKPQLVQICTRQRNAVNHFENNSFVSNRLTHPTFTVKRVGHDRHSNHIKLNKISHLFGVRLIKISVHIVDRFRSCRCRSFAFRILTSMLSLYLTFFFSVRIRFAAIV